LQLGTFLTQIVWRIITNTLAVILCFRIIGQRHEKDAN
jgi:hypothetical protein